MKDEGGRMKGGRMKKTNHPDRPSVFILHPSSFILHPSPFILPPSSFILHPSRAMSEVVITTPEHVPIRLEPAGAGSRFLATLIDFFMVTAISTTVGSLLFFILPNGIAAALVITINFILTWGWHVFFETKKQGRTPGKRALRLRVIDARGLPVSLYQSLVRNIVRVLDFAPAFYGVAAISTLVTPA